MLECYPGLQPPRCPMDSLATLVTSPQVRHGVRAHLKLPLKTGVAREPSPLMCSHCPLPATLPHPVSLGSTEHSRIHFWSKKMDRTFHPFSKFASLGFHPQGLVWCDPTDADELSTLTWEQVITAWSWWEGWLSGSHPRLVQGHHLVGTCPDNLTARTFNFLSW